MKPKYKFDDEGRITFRREGNSVILNPYKPRSLKQFDYMSDAELVNGAGGTLVYDTEIFRNYYLVAFKNIETNKVVKLEAIPDEDKYFNERQLSWIFHNYTLVGFNNIHFDDVINWLAYKTQNTNTLKEAVNDIILGGMRKQDLLCKYDFQIHKTKTIDAIEVAPLEGSLKLYAARIHSPRIQEMPTNHEAYLTAEEIKYNADYCINDLDNTHLLYSFMRERFLLREAMSQKYGEDLMSKSDAQMAEVVLIKEVKKLSGKWPQQPNFPEGYTFKYKVPSYIRYATPAMRRMLEIVKNIDFVVSDAGRVIPPVELKEPVKIGQGSYQLGIGGLHSLEKSVGYKADDETDIIDDDVASYYPRIITNLELYPENLGRYFLEAYENIISERLEAKRTKNFTSDKGLKIFINGASGKFSDPYSKMYDPKLTIQVTLTGQLALLMMIEMLECNGIKVISANTDGIVKIVPKKDYAKLRHWIEFWEKETGFTTEETKYKSYYARDVNAYFATKLNAIKPSDVKVKGPYSEVGSQSGTQLDNNPANLICSDAIKALLVNGTPVEKTIRECTDITRFVTVRNVKGGAHKDGDYLGKVIRYYYAKGIPGTLNYVMTNNKVPDSDGAKPLMDLPETFPDDIDYEKYIAKTIDILEEIGYIVKPKQIKFF